MMTEVPRSSSVMSACKGMNPLTKEQCVIKQSPQTVSQQPVGEWDEYQKNRVVNETIKPL